MKKNDIVIDKNIGKLASIIKANDPYLRVKYIDDNLGEADGIFNEYKICESLTKEQYYLACKKVIITYRSKEFTKDESEVAENLYKLIVKYDEKARKNKSNSS